LQEVRVVIVGVGTDITEVARIRDMVERHGDRFLKRVFTDEELCYAMDRARREEHLAVRFAAKEAVLKAIKTGVGPGTSLHEVEVLRGDKGEPEIRLHGRTAQVAAARGVRRVHLSLSHTESYGLAFVVCEGD
jgi:holo-[acyl-carrier protein] synthase